jgi:hypothetical protein
MNKQKIITIAKWSTAALIIPLLGQLFVDGWNWGPNDFLFAWVFFNLLGLSYTFVITKITNRAGSIVAGVAVIAIFVFVWVMLATG